TTPPTLLRSWTPPCASGSRRCWRRQGRGSEGKTEGLGLPQVLSDPRADADSFAFATAALAGRSSGARRGPDSNAFGLLLFQFFRDLRIRAAGGPRMSLSSDLSVGCRIPRSAILLLSALLAFGAVACSSDPDDKA